MKQEQQLQSNGIDATNANYLWQGTPQALARVAVATQSAGNSLWRTCCNGLRS